MNRRLYSLVWNRAKHQITVASELATCKHGGTNASASGNYSSAFGAGRKATLTIGGSVSGSESSVGAGVGFGW